MTYSSGNHAQAMACAGGLLGVPTTVIMPHDAPHIKVAATQGYGAKVISYDRFAGIPRGDRAPPGGAGGTRPGAAL